MGEKGVVVFESCPSHESTARHLCSLPIRTAASALYPPIASRALDTFAPEQPPGTPSSAFSRLSWASSQQRPRPAAAYQLASQPATRRPPLAARCPLPRPLNPPLRGAALHRLRGRSLHAVSSLNIMLIDHSPPFLWLLLDLAVLRCFDSATTRYFRHAQWPAIFCASLLPPPQPSPPCHRIAASRVGELNGNCRISFATYVLIRTMALLPLPLCSRSLGPDRTVNPFP